MQQFERNLTPNAVEQDFNCMYVTQWTGFFKLTTESLNHHARPAWSKSGFKLPACFDGDLIPKLKIIVTINTPFGFLNMFALQHHKLWSELYQAVILSTHHRLKQKSTQVISSLSYIQMIEKKRRDHESGPMIYTECVCLYFTSKQKHTEVRFTLSKHHLLHTHTDDRKATFQVFEHFSIFSQILFRPKSCPVFLVVFFII